VKCYTAEEVGEAVGLSLDQAKDEVRRISEDIPKSTKVQFSDDYQVPSVFLQHGMRNDLEHLSNRKKLQGGGTGVEYTSRRLARDHESIFAKVKSGELTVNQAAIAAGIRKKPL
jgi:hypothetical protein